MKFCKEHGRQHPKFSFCPYCGLQLNEGENSYRSKYVLPKIRHSEDFMEHLAFKEATAAAWIEIGVYGNISHMLADSGMPPEQIQELLKEQLIEGVGAKGSAVIKQLGSLDFERFNKTCERLKTKGSWCWNLAEWFYNLPDGCNCGQYMAKKLYFKKNTK